MSFKTSTVKQAEVVTVAAALEAVEKYSGMRQIRRTGQQAKITSIWLLFDAEKVPQNLRPVIKKVIADFASVHSDSGLSFEVGIF